MMDEDLYSRPAFHICSRINRHHGGCECTKQGRRPCASMLQEAKGFLLGLGFRDKEVRAAKARVDL